MARGWWTRAGSFTPGDFGQSISLNVSVLSGILGRTASCWRRARCRRSRRESAAVRRGDPWRPNVASSAITVGVLRMRSAVVIPTLPDRRHAVQRRMRRRTAPLVAATVSRSHIRDAQLDSLSCADERLFLGRRRAAALARAATRRVLGGRRIAPIGRGRDGTGHRHGDGDPIMTVELRGDDHRRPRGACGVQATGST